MRFERTGPDIIVNTTGLGYQSVPQAAVLSDGRVLHAWRSSDTGDGSLSCIRVGVVDPARPDETGADFVVNTTALRHRHDGGDGQTAGIRAMFFETHGPGVTWTGTDGDDAYVGTDGDDRCRGWMDMTGWRAAAATMC
jgi:hypothetical protein